MNCSKSAKLTISVFRSGRISSSASRKYLTSPSLLWNLKAIQENVSQPRMRLRLNTAELRGGRRGSRTLRSVQEHDATPESSANSFSNSTSPSAPPSLVRTPAPPRGVRVSSRIATQRFIYGLTTALRQRNGVGFVLLGAVLKFPRLLPAGP